MAKVKLNRKTLDGKGGVEINISKATPDQQAIGFVKKLSGERIEGKLHDTFEVAGDGKGINELPRDCSTLLTTPISYLHLSCSFMNVDQINTK